jgi:formylglycine-generating enzyme required for sulfatase activity/fibronectin type 3 domain-containing protein
MKEKGIIRRIIVGMAMLAGLTLVQCEQATSGDWSDTIWGVPSGRLPAPKNVNALAEGNEKAGSIYISWNAVEQAEGYNVFRAAETTPDKYVRCGSTSEHEYTDSGSLISPEKNYRYRVSAYNEVETSKESAETNWVSPEGDLGILPAPRNVTAAVSDNTITLSWAVVLNATGYAIFRSSQFDNGVYMNLTDPFSTSYSDNGLQPGAYSYQVKAYNDAGDGYMSAPVSATVEGSGGGGTGSAPSAPQNLRASVAADTDAGTLRIALSWDAVSGVTKYVVYRSADEENYTDIGTSTATHYDDDSSVSADSIRLGGSYYYRVRGYTGEQQGYISETYGPVVSKPATPALTVTADGMNVTLNWNAVSGADGYYVSRSADGVQYPRLTLRAIVATAYTDTPSAAGTYRYRVNAYNSAGQGGDAELEVTVPAVLAVPAPPAPDTPIVATGDGQLTIRWTPVAEATAYEVWVGTSPDSSVANMRGNDITGDSAVITDLTNGTTYYVWVKAKNSAGTSDFSQMASGVPVAPLVAPQAPAAPTVTAGDTQLTVNWAAVDGATAYEVWYGTTNNSASAAKYDAEVTGSSATISGLTNGATYHVWIKAKNSGGTSGFSPDASGTPLARLNTSIIITLSPQTDMDGPGQSAVILRGESRDFQVTEGYAGYQWYLNGIAISGATSASYTLDTAAMSLGAYELSVAVRTDTGVRLSGRCSVSVEELFVTVPGTTVIGSGDEGVFVSGRTVTVASFAIAKYETTYDLWYEVRMWAEANEYIFANQGREGAFGTDGVAPTTAKDEPVTMVSWWDIIVWCNAYSEKSGREPVYTYQNAVIRSAIDATACDNAVMDKTKSGFRLPTEVEWEFAVRGGNPSDTTNWNYTYAGSDTVGDVAWYEDNSGSTTHPVGTKAANSLGLYDMSGNVWEWCWDWSGSISDSMPTDGASSGSHRVFRGGGWGHYGQYLRLAYRVDNTPSQGSDYLGFRVLRPSL